MKNRVWMNIVMAILVAGLFFTASCAKKTIVSGESTIETSADVATDTAQEDADKIAQEEIDKIFGVNEIQKLFEVLTKMLEKNDIRADECICKILDTINLRVRRTRKL